MNVYNPDGALSDWELVFGTQRSRLVRLCATMTGNADIAEDLAQETLLEAWRHHASLRNAPAQHAWLTGIARNVCRRWQRQQARQCQLLVTDDTALLIDDAVAHADHGNVEIEIERAALATLLDRALALLPPLTRAILVHAYVDALPQAEIAARVGLSETAVAVRLHRGKRAIRRLLATDLRADAAAYGLVEQGETAGHCSHIWCPFCGHERLMSHNDRPNDVVAFRCPTCSTAPDMHVVYIHQPQLLVGLRSTKAMLSRQLRALDDLMARAVHAPTAPCLRCGRLVPVRCVPPVADDALHHRQPGIYFHCMHCYPTPLPFPTISRAARALQLPQTQHFWRAHPRMQVLPDRLITYANQLAILTRYQSWEQSAALDIISAPDTFMIWAVH
jgi:RNA polymerase sigma-70 factor (ECF subfamily)